MCDFADKDLLFRSWNVRSLLECSGDVRTSRSRPVSGLYNFSREN